MEVPPDSDRLPTGDVTFLFTDIEGSTRLVQRLGTDYTEILDRHNRLIREAIALGGGTEFGTEGDAFFVAFPDAAGALRSAVDAQQRLSREPWPDGVDVRVRIGLHTGEGRVGGGSYVGLDVNRAARIAAAGHGGQVLVSSITADLVRSHLPTGVSLADMGRHSLKDLDRPEHLYQLVIEGLPSDFPPLRARSERSLPAPVTSLVGREVDLDSTRRLLLRPGLRLLTVTGPGGTGKTRLATELLHLVGAEFPDGIHYLDLSGVTDPALVLPALGRVLGIIDAEGREIAHIAAGLIGTARVLVLLDNMEQVLAAGPDLAAVLEHTTNLRLLVTSREPLRIRGEFEYPLNPLAVPPRGSPLARLGEAAAVQLFVERARAVIPGFELSDDNAAAIAELVRHLDGLPLAIELAVPKLRVLSPSALLERMGRRLDLLTGGTRDMPERHHTLRAAISWSYDLLDDEARRLFRRLGVFAGGWTLDAALAVSGEPDPDEDRLLDVLSDLVSKSMVTFYLDAAGQPRYRLLETLRAYALEQLVEAGEEADIRTAHLEWCLDFVQHYERGYTSAEFPHVLDVIELERHNIRAGLEWVLSNPIHIEKGLQIAGTLWIFWDVRGYATEGEHWLRRLLATPEAAERTRGRAIALDAAGWLGRLTPESASPDADFSEADQIWRELGDTRWLAWSLSMHGMITYNAYQPERAREQFEEGARLAREIGDEPLAEIWCYFGLAHVYWMTGAMDTAEQLLLRSLDFARKWNHVWAIGHAQFSYGILDFLKGDIPQARERLRESLGLRRDMRDLRGIADCLGALALVAGAGGDHRTAARLLGAADAQREAAGQVLVPWLEPFFDQIRQESRARLDEEPFDRAVRDGRGLSRAEAVALGLDQLAAPATS